LLFTFEARKLLVRHPECPLTHSDHMIHAIVMDLRNNRLTAETDWYAHDYRSYLWPLGNGRFLVRRLDSIFLVGADLNEKLLFTSASELLWSGVTADRKQLIVEFQGQGQPAGANTGHPPNHAGVRIEFRDVDSLEVKKSLSAPAVSEMEPLSSGYADSVQNLSRKVWLVRFGSSATQRRNLMRVQSACHPDLLFPTDNTLFVGRCSPSGSDYSVSVFTLSGHPLWRQRWSQRQFYPAVVSSEDGSRIAVSTVTASRDEGPSTSSDDEEGWPDAEQDIRVLETATGQGVLSTHSKTVILRGGNYSLSPDGHRLAVIDGTVLYLYDLPAPTAEERAKYLAMEAGAPDLVAPSVFPDEDTTQDLPNEELRTGADKEGIDIAALTRNENRSPVESLGLSGEVSKSQGSTLANSDGDDRNGLAQSLTTFRARAEEVVVDVVATDSKGHAAKGLSKDDFQAEENGKPQRLRSFREYGNGPVESPKAAASTPPPPNVFNNNDNMAADQPVGIILLDFLNTEVADQGVARQQLIKFLRKKPAEMKFAICTLTDRVQLLQGFTADENLLLANLNDKRARPKFSSQLQRVDLGGLIQTLKQEAQFDGRAWLQGSVQNLVRQQTLVDAAQLDRRAALTTDALAQLARYLAPIPGRKSLIWLSGSFPNAFSGARALSVDSPNQSNIELTFSDRLRTTANLLAQAHIVVYPVNVHGLKANALPGADDNSHFEPTGLPGSRPLAGAPGMSREDTGTNRVSSIAAASPMQQEVQRQTDARMAEEETMDQVASETGGKAFQNTNGLAEAVQTAADLGSHYYMLSYSPEKQAYDGTFRKIKVSLAKKGYHVAHRRGYYAIDQRAAGAGKTDLVNTMNSAAMQHGSLQARQLVFAARVVPVGRPRKEVNPSSSGAGKALIELQRYSVDYMVPASELQFGAKGEAHTTDLVFLSIAFGETGTPLNRSAVEHSTTLNLKAYQDAVIGGLRAHQEFEVPASATSLRLGVIDLLSRHLGTLELPLPLTAPPEEARFTQGKLPPVEPK
jgi:VWFA-related protein